MKKWFVVLLLVLSVTACSSDSKSFPVHNYSPSSSYEDDQVRPVINKTSRSYEEQNREDESSGVPSDVPRNPVDQLSTPVEQYKLSVGYGIVGLNQTLGKFAPEFSKYEFPDLLKSRNIRGGVEGVAGSYEQFLKPLGGRVMFTADEEDRVSDYLVYRDEEPIFRYELVLSDGSFLDFIDEEIWLLGYKYTIKDATKEDVVLEGVDNGNELVIGGGSVKLNGETLADTDSRMTGDKIIVVAKVDAKNEGDNIYIPFNHSLQEFLGDPTVLTDKVDIRYKGIVDVPRTKLDFNNKGDELELYITGPRGRESIIPLGFLIGDGWRLGDEEGVLHVSESTGISDYKVGVDDYFVLSSGSPSRQAKSLSTALQYKGVTPVENEVEFVSRSGLVIEAGYNGTEGENAKGYIHFAGKDFKFYIGGEESDYRIAVDMNGNGRIDGAVVDFKTRDGVIDLPSQSEFSGPANVSLELFNYKESGRGSESSTFEIRPGDEFSIKMFTDKELFDMQSNDKVMSSVYGTQYFLFNERDDKVFEEVVIDHPLEKRRAEVVVESSFNQ